MDLLKRGLAPIVPEAWAAVDGEAKRVLALNLAGRKLVDFDGPHGWKHAAVNTGRLSLFAKGPAAGVGAGLREAQPLLELRVPFHLEIMELDLVARGAADIDLEPVSAAAEKIARAEDGAIFGSYKAAGIAGIIPESPHKPLKITSLEKYPQLLVEARETLYEAGIDGPYGLALSPRCYKEISQATEDGYPLRKRIDGQIIDGPLVRAPFIEGAVVMSMRGGDFQLSVGQDLSIGYAWHDKEKVELYLTESFTFRTLEPAPPILLKHRGGGEGRAVAPPPRGANSAMPGGPDTAESGEIRISDLGSPVLSDLQKMAIEAMRQRPVELREEVVLAAAVRQTGLSDFGSPDFLPRLRVWLAAVEEDADLGPLGRRMVYGNCVRILANRLRVEDLLERHPEIHDVEIRAPIIIAGLPRSGTTHLVNLISADARLRSLPYWESLEPVPDPGEVVGEGEEDPRLRRCREAYAQQDALMPLLRAMHPMPPEHVHEEIELQELDFSTYNLEWYARVPRWRDFYLSYDQTPHYLYLKKVLKVLQWQRGPDRWILKSPQHMEHLAALRRAFPDATLVMTHRDPVSVVQSAITMLAYGDRVRRTRVDLEGVASYWIDRVERLLRACVRDRAVWPAAQSIDVLFHEFMADDVAMVDRIYELANLEMTAAARARLEAFMTQHPRGKHGRVRYDLMGDFGIAPGALRRRFDFYGSRFPVRPEVE